ncbi:MAG: hypothetical protein AAB581_04185 [Patescibacteria group bacterium]
MNSNAETKTAEGSREMNRVPVCPVCLEIRPTEGFTFLPMQCGHEGDVKALPAVFKEGDKYICGNCDLNRPGNWEDRLRPLGGKEGIILHMKEHQEANNIRAHGAIVKEETYATEFGHGIYSSVGMATERTWGLAGRFCTDKIRASEENSSKGRFLSVWGALVYESSTMLEQLAAERAETLQKIEALERDIVLPLSPLGREMVNDALDKFRKRVAAIQRALS